MFKKLFNLVERRRVGLAGIVAVAAAALALLASTPRAAAQRALESFRQSLGTGGDKVDLLADRATYELDGHWATFIGNVVIRYGDQELRADRVRFNSETYDAQAFGRVTVVGADGSVWSGDSLNVNLKEKSGAAGGMDIYYAPFRLEVGKGEVRQGVYYAEDVVMTTCTNKPGSCHYEFRVKDVRLRPDRDLSGHHMVAYVYGVPFFYFPYIWKDLKRHYGLRFEPGYRSRWGAYLLTSYKARLFRDEENRWVDSRTSLDVRSKRGLAYGERLNWYLNQQGDGWLSLYFIDDRKDPLPRGVEDKSRYRLRLNHAADITSNDRVLLQGLYVSDDQVMREFFENEYAQMHQPESYLSYTHTAMDYSFGVIARPRLNDFYTQVERLPEGWLNINQREIAHSGIFYESRSSASYLRMEFDERPQPPRESYDSGRLDTWHSLNMPLKIGGVLTFVPRTSYRGTYYTKSLKETTVLEPKTITTTNMLGHVSTSTTNITRTVIGDAGSTFRNVVEFGAEASFKAIATWADADGTLWRHVIEPYANYTYIPEPDVLPSELRQFDSIDAIDFTHVVRLGNRHYWRYKQGDRAREFAMVDVYGDLLLEPRENEKRLDRIVLDSEFRPVPWMRIDVDGEYSLTDSQVDTGSTRLVVWHDKFSTSLEYRYRAGRSGLAMGSITLPVSKEWAVSMHGRYEFDNGQLEEIGGYLQRSHDCLAYRLYASVLPGYTRTDGSVERDDYRISFVAWLTAFAPENVRESHFR